MGKKLPIFLFVGLFFSVVSVYSSSDMEIRNFFNSMITQSSEYANRAGKAQFQEYAKEQNPFATLIFCSDSRVQLNKFFPDAVNRLFIIRVAGNLVDTAAGSIEYGINYLKTPVVIVMAHSECGLINAALGDTSKFPTPLRSEVEMATVDKKKDLNHNIVFNLHEQVEHIKSRYPHVVVVGLLYDFSNAYQKGYGALIFVNMDGQKDPKAIKESIRLQGLNPIVLD